MEKNKTCKQLIKKELKGRIKEFKKALSKINNRDFDFVEWINEIALAYSDEEVNNRVVGKRLELSWGGPQDYFVFKNDDNIFYHYLDWFDGAKLELEGEDYEVMKEVRDYLNGF